jgi:5-methylcytosine-specific restriction endonuclease McrA
VKVTYADGRVEVKRASRITLAKKPKSSSWQHRYEAYLASPEWRALRRRAIRRDEGRCVKCGSKMPLQVHHLTYARMGHEQLDDLVTLCKACHELTHASP